MAHRGVPPKVLKHGRSTNAEWTEVTDVPFPGPSPDLPRLPYRRKWHSLVEQWWEQVRVMPHCVLWRPPDWMFAIETAIEKHEYYTCDPSERKTTAATEIRRREAQLGTTAEARRQLRIRYVPVLEVDEDGDGELAGGEQQRAGAEGATVTSLAARRRNLTA